MTISGAPASTNGNRRAARRPRQPIRERPRDERDGKSKRTFAADQGADHCGRIGQAKQHHRAIGREHTDRERQPEGGQTEQAQKRPRHRERLALAGHLQVPALTVPVLTLRQPVDDASER